MATYTTSGNTFVNPYNFVSLDKECYKTIDYQKRKQAGNSTGWIECSLETLTPIFIPNTTNSDVFQKRTDDGKLIKSYDFYSYTNLEGIPNPEESKPVIPGSEIRGMIRSAFEAVTNSCLSTIDDEQKLYKRVTSPAKPGQLVFQDNEWKIIECRKYRLPKEWVTIVNGKIIIRGEEYGEGSEVYVKINYKNFKIVKISKNLEQGLRKGFLHIGEYNENKNYESVFIHHSDKKSNEIIEKRLDQSMVPEILNGLIENILLYRAKSNKTENHHQYKHFDNFMLKTISNLTAKFLNSEITIDEFNNRLQEDFKPAFSYLKCAAIYFVNHNNKYYLSPAAIGREVFYNRLTDIIGSFTPCEKLDQLCQACALFGLVGKDAAASRVRFTDALVSGAYEYHDPQILKELASPKLSATEFYLKRPEQSPDLWNYDYAGNWEKKYDRVTNRWRDITSYTPAIRGRKFYWHSKNPNPFLLDNSKRSERNVCVRPLKKGAVFTFKIYFNDISKEELDNLLWILEIGGSKNHAHKIGMGKPIGMGSVRINADSVKIRDICLENGSVGYAIQEYQKPAYADIEANLINADILKEFLNITAFQKAPENVKYPCNDDSDKVYEWFVANKQIRGTGTSPVIYQTLPEIGEPPLKSYTEESKKKTIIIHKVAPFYLTVRNIGPFFEPVIFDFTDNDGESCNFYLIVSENGRGKTTALELMAFLMKMLEYDSMESFGHDGLDKNYGSVQWDLLVKYNDNKERTVVLSLLAGSFDRSSVSKWDDDRLNRVKAESWHQFGFWRNESGRLERLGANDGFINDLLNEIRIHRGKELIGFEDQKLSLPTLLYFSAYRNIPPIRDKEESIPSMDKWKPDRWGYQCIRLFDQEGTQWRQSADNLFVWLDHIDKECFERARQILNDRIFRGKQKYFKEVRKDPPEAVIDHKGRQHSFDKLSSGEKSLLQLFSFLGAYMTENTILLIDEMDVHLHPKLQIRLLNLLKKMVKDHPGLTVIATTHSLEILTAFAFEIREDGLHKGGYIIDDEL